MKMRKFDTKVQHLKYKVLREVARLAWDDKLLENVMDIPGKLAPGKEATMRCCVYKENGEPVNRQFYLYENGKLEELINNIVNFESFDNLKTSKEKSFMQYLISDNHRNNCLTACQKCLLTYTNRGFHHILDWRLGIGLLRLMLDKTYDFGFDAENRSKYNELSDWNHIVQECSKKFNIELENQNVNYLIKNGNCTVFYHPIWNKEKCKNEIKDKYDSIDMFNTFKVLRSDFSVDLHITTNSCNNFLRRTKKVSAPLQIVTTDNKSKIDDDDDFDLHPSIN